MLEYLEVDVKAEETRKDQGHVLCEMRCLRKA